MCTRSPGPYGATPLPRGLRTGSDKRVLESPVSRAARTTHSNRSRSITMGKGDRKTAKGKRYNASYGNARSHATTKAAGTAAASVVKKAATKTAVKAPAKKVVAKKA
ncbi:30S ribosomal protein THX [Thermomonas sp.]|uniref:30S ribosomal protein THX n=1 Tax=Thermomonas sp. TaxID=1971895 RepID=UPI0035B1DF70